MTVLTNRLIYRSDTRYKIQEALFYVGYIRQIILATRAIFRLPTLYWLPKLHKRPYKSRFIANSSACTTTELSILLTSCLTAIKTMSLNIAQHFMKEMVKNYFELLKIQVKFLIN